ncbi:hypothetical protein D3C79_902450 [compost metagenome]
MTAKPSISKPLSFPGICRKSRNCLSLAISEVSALPTLSPFNIAAVRPSDASLPASVQLPSCSITGIRANTKRLPSASTVDSRWTFSCAVLPALALVRFRLCEPTIHRYWLSLS